MNIEPISSAMTYTAQSAPVKQVQNQPENDSAALNMDVTADKANQIDPKTMVIKDVEQKDDGSEDKNSGNEPSQGQQAQQESIKKAVEEINKKMMNSEAIFGIHDKTNRVTIKIVDKETKKVIKEYPPEKTLDMIAKAWEMAGIMVDEKR